MNQKGVDLVTRILKLKSYMRKDNKHGPYRVKYHPSLKPTLEEFYHDYPHNHLTIKERILQVSKIKEMIPIENPIDLKENGMILEQIEEKNHA